MAHITWLVCLVGIVGGYLKDTLRRDSASSRHITKLEQFIFLQISMVLSVNDESHHRCYHRHLIQILRVLSVAAAKILALITGTFIVNLPALLAPLPCWPTCLVGPPALLCASYYPLLTLRWMFYKQICLEQYIFITVFYQVYEYSAHLHFTI